MMLKIHCNHLVPVKTWWGGKQKMEACGESFAQRVVDSYFCTGCKRKVRVSW
jgi:hypothetical protein